MPDKATAVAALRRLGLDRTRTAVIPLDHPEMRLQLASVAGGGGRLVLRTSGGENMLNLPRVIDISVDAALDWVLRLPTGVSTVIAQPYADLEFCGQLALYPQAVIVELVPGLWDNDKTPAVLVADLPVTGHRLLWRQMRSPLGQQPARWRYAGADPVLALVEPWMVGVTRSWIDQHLDGLRHLCVEFGGDVGVKLHYTIGLGIAAQNVYTDLPPLTHIQRRVAVPDGVPVLTDINEPVTDGPAVILRASVARESAQLLDDLIMRMRVAGVRQVYLQSGLLSHIAIGLREAGFETLPA
jgi:hypothetical protein